MESNEAFQNLSNGLSSPYDYLSHPSDGFVGNHPPRPSNHTDFEDPDDFYRPFAERSSQPDIILQTDTDVMATPGKRRHTNVNGSESKPPSSSSTAATRPTVRSASGPTLNSTKSTPVLATASRARNGLIKERLKQFDKSREGSPEAVRQYGRARTPSGQRTSASAASNQSPPPPSRLPKGRNVVSPKGKSNSSDRRPLFGEVLDETTGAHDAGFGIPRAIVEATQEVQSMHQPNAMFSRSRSHSDLETSQPSSPSHNRAHSDASNMPGAFPGDFESASSTTSPTSAPASPTFQTTTSFSRIPVKTREGADVNGIRQRTTPEPRPPSNLLTLSSRRYSPNKRNDPTQSLTAVVKAPPPKSSPTLRSTRARPPVTVAHTASSRSKVADRHEKLLSNSGTASRSKPKLSVPGQVDIAERRARLQKSLQGASGQDKPVRQDVKALQGLKSVAPKKMAVDELELAGHVIPPEVPPPVPTLNFPIAKAATPPKQGHFVVIPNEGDHMVDPETDFEDSPILGHDEHRSLPLESSAGESRSIDKEEVIPAPVQSDGLFQHILSIRDSSPSASSRTALPDDFLSQADDGETIQILLGETPILPQHNWKSPETEQSNSSPEAFHTPREEEGSDDEGAMFDNRSSIYPDDSVSMVFQRRYADIMASEPVPPLPVNAAQFAQRQDFTLNSDARSEINRVLDQYQDGHVTPEMAHGFQKKVESLTPDLARHNAWESAEATRGYLRNILGEEEIQEEEVREESLTMPASLQTLKAPPVENVKAPFIQAPKLPPIVPIEDEEEEAGGIAIIYGPSYNRSSNGSFAERSGTLHSHSASNSTLRPPKEDDSISHTSYLDDLVFRPEPPPKDSLDRRDGRNVEWPPSPRRPHLPEISTTGSGLGLSLGKARANSPPKSPHPPRPVYAPPPPPTPIVPASLSLKQQNNSTSSLQQQQNSIAYAKRAHPDIFASAGLPESPAPRGRTQHIGMENGTEIDPHSASNSEKVSLEIEASRSQSPLRANSGDERRSMSQVPAAQPDKREKAFKDRKNRLKELVDTEHSFHQDMTILSDIYMGTSSSVLGSDEQRILFGNVEQVRVFSMNFLDTLKKAAGPVYIIPKENRWNYKRGSFGTSNSGATGESSSVPGISIEECIANDRKTTIGAVFVENVVEIESVYGPWLKNHFHSNKLLIELQSKPDVKFWLDECHDSAKDITQAWSLDSLIIKPTQRLMKYPLLLEDLLKCTSEDHPDRSAIAQALESVRKATQRINDLRKRTELVAQAMSKPVESTSNLKINKLFNLRGEKVMQTGGRGGPTGDQEYEAVAQKFGGHFFQLQVVMRDIERYIEDTKANDAQFSRLITALVQNFQAGQYPEQESKWLKIGTVLREISDKALVDHVRQVRNTVVAPIEDLWHMHAGPQKMMACRKARIPAYLRHKAQLEKGEKPEKNLTVDVDEFKALTDTLKEDLPKLYSLTKTLIEAVLQKLAFLQIEWNTTWKRKIEPFVDDGAKIAAMTIPETMAYVEATYSQDVGEIVETFDSMKLCNGATIAEAKTFLSPATTYTRDDESSYRRPSTLSGKRTLSLNSEEPLGTPVRVGASMALSPLVGSFALPDGVSQPGGGRNRASSAMSSRGPSTPHSTNAGPSTYPVQRPYTSSERSGELSPPGPRLSLELNSPGRQHVDQNYLYPNQMMSGQTTPDERFSGIFHSALPMSDSPRVASPEAPLDGDARVIFLAASLFEFHIDSTRKEAGYPYLTYQPGEVFDVVGTKGELWLAKNQDDASNTIGWIWEKHFARILPEQY